MGQAGGRLACLTHQTDHSSDYVRYKLQGRRIYNTLLAPRRKNLGRTSKILPLRRLANLDPSLT
jgi:hypothetical protein